MNKINKKKAISMLFSLVLASSLAACSGVAQARPDSTAGAAAASNLTASNITASSTCKNSVSNAVVSVSSSNNEADKLKTVGTQAEVKAVSVQNTASCPKTAVAVANTASCPKTTVAANTSTCQKTATVAKTSNCPTSALAAALANTKSCNVLSYYISSGNTTSCNTYFCNNNVCGKISCNTASCVTASCKANSCKSTVSSSQNSSSKPSISSTPSASSSSSRPTASSSATGTVTQTNATIANQVLQLINAERAKNGVAALTMNTNAAKAAQVRANEIVQQFSHTRPNGESCFTALKEFNASYSTAGENIAYGQPDAQSVVSGWMNSPGHRANILNGKFTQTGIGVYRNANGTYYWTQEFIG